jgi:hypothetical protein
MSLLPGRRDSGQSLIETIVLGLLFLVPVIWALGVLADLHRGALAATAAAREAGFEAARSTSQSEAASAARAAFARAFANHGLDPGLADLRLATPAGMERGSAVEVEVSYPVTVLQAPILGRIAGPSIWVRAAHVSRIDPYRSRE